jgi:ubiquinone biosynthesis monooxygenase Coq7
MRPNERSYGPIDHFLTHIQHALTTALGPAPTTQSLYPADHFEHAHLNEQEQRHAAGLMRVNHTGEVSAQALYLGQAAVSRQKETHAHLIQAAHEEADHLAWCALRLKELNDHPSKLNLLWYGGSFAIGTLAGLMGDKISFGFVAETERQVEAHLAEHLNTLPKQDQRSRAIIEQMQLDEVRHGAQAQAAGGVTLPKPIPQAMRLAASVMKWVAYRC